MLVIDPTVRAAHARLDLNAGMRYAVVRLAELLDPRTPFALSACSYCDPLTAAAAFESAAVDHLANPGVRFGTVLAASQLLSDALAQEGNLREWYPGDLTRLLLFLAQLRRVPAVKTVGERQVKVAFHERTTWVRQKLEALAGGSLARFRASLEDPVSGYRARLLAQLCQRLCRAPADERGWAELEHDLCYTAALLLAGGRDGPELARAAAAGVAEAGDDAAAVEALRRVAAAGPSAYQVAMVLAGAGAVEAGPAAGVGVIDPSRPSWAPAAPDPPKAAARGLRTFVAERAAAGAATPLLLRVEACDPEQARLRAQAAAETLRDRLVAEHPGAEFSLLPEALVLDVASGAVRRAGAPARPVPRARVGRCEGDAELAPFLRANALARGVGGSPALTVLHSWIALERLARDCAAPDHPGRPALALKLEAYLPPHVASAAAMAGLRAVVLTSWDEARALALGSPRREDWRRLERRLGRPGPARLVALLRSLPEVPSLPEGEERDGGDPSALAELLAGVGPFPARRLADLGRRLDHGSRLAKLAEGVQVRALIAVARLKLARHLAVHRGLDAAEVSPALALGSLLLLDAALDVLRRWLRPGCTPAGAMAAARAWHERNLRAWRSAAELELDADHLLHPEKQ